MPNRPPIVDDDDALTTTDVRRIKALLDNVPQDVLLSMARDYQSAKVTFRVVVGFGSLITGILIFVGFDHVANFVKHVAK